jgi:hypothetical protein
VLQNPAARMLVRIVFFLCSTNVIISAVAPFCALCRTSSDLQNSHIIPEFFYRLIYDSNPRRFHIVSGNPSERESFAQKGLRETLLCRACEQKLGKWEHQSKAAFVDGKGLRITALGDRVLLRGFHYKTFKLFQLSLLWRMSVSTLPFFKDVVLGPHDEVLRQALLNDDPLRPDQYPCWMIALQISGKPVIDWMLEPSLTRLDGHHIYWLVITGIMFSYYVGSHPPPSEISALTLNDTGEMAIIIQEAKTIPALADALKRLGAAIQARKKGK